MRRVANKTPMAHFGKFDAFFYTNAYLPIEILQRIIEPQISNEIILLFAMYPCRISPF